MADFYDFYEERIGELSRLLNKAQSNTSRTLLQQAITISEKAAQECLLTGQKTIEQVKKLNEKEELFNNQIFLLRQQSAGMNAFTENPALSIQAREKFKEAWDMVIAELEQQYKLHSTVLVTQRGAILYCQRELDKVLFEFIFKPDASSFNIDIILEYFKKLVQKLVPYIDDIESLYEMNAARKKSKYLGDGDKFLMYIEKYISVLESWLAFSEQFKSKVLN